MNGQSALIERVEMLLEETDEFYIPVKHLWKTLVMEGHPINLENLSELLKSNSQFNVFVPDHPDAPNTEISLEPGDIDINQELQYNLEALGYYDGARVSLSARQPSTEDLKNLVQKHLGNMTEALNKASAACPSDDTETHQKLKELLDRAELVRQNLSDLMNSSDGA